MSQIFSRLKNTVPLRLTDAITFSFFFSLLVVPVAANAQDNRQIPGYQGDAGSREDNVEGKPWSFIIGTGVGIGPLTEGSGDTELIPLPVFNITYRDFFYIDALDGIGISPVSTETTFFSIDANIANSRSAQNDQNSFLNDGDFERFAGLGDVDGDFALEAYASHLFWGVVEASVSARREFGNVDGWQVTAGLASGFEVQNDLFVGMQVSTTWSSANYSRAFFGVTETQAAERLAISQTNAAVTPYSVFDAGAGITDVSIGVGAFKTFGKKDQFFATVEAGYSFALGDLRDSPITERTATPGGTFSIGWQF